MSAIRPLELVLAAVRVVAPHALGGHAEPALATSGAQLLGWIERTEPVGAAILARLTDDERADVRQVLDGMLRESAFTSGAPAGW